MVIEQVDGKQGLSVLFKENLEGNQSTLHFVGRLHGYMPYAVPFYKSPVLLDSLYSSSA